jgi:hypothetical protein
MEFRRKKWDALIAQNGTTGGHTGELLQNCRYIKIEMTTWENTKYSQKGWGVSTNRILVASPKNAIGKTKLTPPCQDFVIFGKVTCGQPPGDPHPHRSDN